MKAKVEVFVSSLLIFCIIFLTWHNWSLTSKQIAEMVFIGAVSSLTLASLINPLARLIQNLVRKITR